MVTSDTSTERPSCALLITVPDNEESMRTNRRYRMASSLGNSFRMSRST